MMYRFLMCAPQYFDVEYVINPWMEGKKGTASNPVAVGQWNVLHTILGVTLGADILFVPAQPDLPDLVFTANAACVKNGVALLSSFRPVERQGEEPHYQAALEAAGYEVRTLPHGITFEGAGDALFYEGRTDKTILFAGYGIRTGIEALPILAGTFDAEVIPLRLIAPHFYHLDTCFCPLPGGYVLWYPPAFDDESQSHVRKIVGGDKLLAVSEEDASAFACNAIGIDNHVVMNAATDSLRSHLQAWGFLLHTTPLSEFMKAGGSAKCLTLRLW